ncbi:GM20404 [Drosophila sechellia]|uniref:Midasin n=1 Tax=Drosophila sechellia TaxID=7238 RepID=B4HNU4_DROSE|nr:GM20404 [Drosophila sechellia]
MEVNVSKLRLGAQRLLELTANESEDNVFSQSLQKFVKKQKYVPQDVERLFRSLSEQLPLPAYTVPIAASFEEQLLLLLSMALRWDSASQRFHTYQLECVALSKLMNFSLDAQRFAKSYFHDKPAPFEKQQSNGSLPSKKSKNGNHADNLEDLELIKCCFQLLKSDTPYFRELWDWSSFIATYTHNSSSPKTRLYCNYIVAMLTNMSALQLNSLNEKISTKTRLEFDQEREQAWNTARNTLCSYTPDASDQLLNLHLQGINQSVTNIEGVLLPTFNKENLEFYASTDGCYDRIVKVDSTVVNLRSIALGVAAAKPICLSGPVGCGKTTLIEYLARKTGRICPKPNEIESREKALKKAEEEEQLLTPKKKAKTTGSKRKLEELPLEELLDLGETTKKSGFLRIQLGDQTDSKMLLGQYRCTDVPGEFVWLPGVLTQAVMHGYWLLLEDLDAATQDTYTILSSLLERQCLSVPGFRDSVKIEPGFQLFVTVRTNKSASNSSQKSLYSLLDKYLYTINILPLSRNELCKMVSINYPKLSTVANRIVDVFLTFSSGNHTSADNLRQQESGDKADNTEQYVALPFEQVPLTSSPNSGRLVSTRDLSKEKVTLITSIGAKLGIIRSRCEHFANEYKPDVEFGLEHIKIGRASLLAKSDLNNSENEDISEQDLKRQKLSQQTRRAIGKVSNKRTTFSFTRLASCILERIAVCVTHSEPVLLVGETGVGKTSSVQYLAERTEHKLVVVNMNNQSDVSDLVGGFKPVELNYVLAPLRNEFEYLVCDTFNQEKNLQFLRLFATHYNSGRHAVIIRTMINICLQVAKNPELKANKLLPRWQTLREKLQKLQMQLDKSINISFAFIPGSLVNCISNGDWVLLDEINLASAETLECLSTILEPEGSVVLLERGDFTPVKRHPDFRIFACMNPNTDIGKKDLPVGIRNRFTEFFVDELTTEADLSLLVSDYLANTGIQRKSVHSIVQLYKSLRKLSELQLNDGLGNRPVYSLRTLCRSLRICARNLCGSIERNLYESFCLSFLTQLDPDSHHVVLLLIQNALLSNVKAILSKQLPQLGDNYLDFEGYWIQPGNLEPQPCTHYILTESVKKNLKDLARIISIGKLPILLQGPTSAGKTSLIDYVARRSGNRCLRINNHEHTDLQEYIGTYAADLDGKLTFREGVLVQAMRHGFWIILDELNLASTDILEALNRVLDDNRELYIAETQTLVKAHPNFMLFATQNPPGLYGGRKTLSRAFKNRFIELHFADIPRGELETILEKRCFIPPTYARKMVQCMTQLQQHRKNTSKQVFTLRDLFRWGNRYTHADKSLHDDNRYDWNQHLVEEGYLVLSSKVRSQEEHELIEKTLFANFRKKLDLQTLFDIQTERENSSMVSRKILDAIRNFKLRDDIVWTRNMTRMAVVTAKALEFDEPVLLVGPTGCGKTTVCQLLASIADVQLRILNCHMHTEGADFLGGLRPCRGKESTQLFEWADGPLIYAMQEGSYFMADEISLAEDSVLERLNCILEPERTVLLAEKGGISELDASPDFVVQAKSGFQFLATMNPGGDFGKKELSPALRNRFTEVWCLPSDNKEDLIEIAYNCMRRQNEHENQAINTHKVAEYLVDVVLHIRDTNDKFKFSVRDILAWANYMVSNAKLSFAEQAIFGLETIFLDALEMLPHESQEQVELLKSNIVKQAIKQASLILQEKFTLEELSEKRGTEVELNECRFGIRPFFIDVNQERLTSAKEDFLFDAPTTKQNLFRLLSALSLQKPVLLEGPPGVGKTSIVESIGSAIGYQIVRINLCEHTDLADLFGTDLPAEDNLLESNTAATERQIGSFVWRDGPLLAALKAKNTWILLDELNLAPQSVLEGLNAVLDHRGEVYIPELNKSFHLAGSTRIFACQNPLKQGGGRKGLPQSFLNRFTKVYLRKLSTEDLLHVVTEKYGKYFNQLNAYFSELLDQKAEGNLFEIYSGMEGSCKSDSFDLGARLVRFSEQLDRGVASMEFGYKGGPYEFNLRDILRWCDLLHNPQTGYILGASPSSFQAAFKDFLLTLYERMQLVYYQRMRCDQDKSYIRNVFSTVFVCDAEHLNQISNDVALYWTADKVYLNDVVLSRKQADVLDLVNRQEQAPLLLDSQRQQLKQIVEAVHMEKPLLLCGSTDSGKTKLIDALCVLSNRLCNTDIIDDSVTGSFQQHMFSEPHQHSVLDELKLFSERLGSLGKIIEVLEATPQNCQVRALQQLAEVKSQLLMLQAYIKTADSLNTGGSFEWVDSQIVTSLKCGQYILLEHVNLCSSAVLDRLNPVFEPNGSLLIAEKGISAQDSAEVVYKSTNFRAFLTVDPKNGELSRAMRNRCVELSLSRDTYSVDDLRAFVHEQGVREMEAIDCILGVHTGLSQLTEFNNYSISHLTQFAFLSAAYRRIGYELKRAIYVAAMEVYVYSANTDLMGYGLSYYQNKLREVVLAQTEVFEEGAAIQEDFLSDVIINSGNLNSLTLIKRQAVALKVLLDGYSEQRILQKRLSSLFQEMEKLKLDQRNPQKLIRHFLYMLYESSAFGDLELRHLYIQSWLSKDNAFQELSQNLYNCLNIRSNSDTGTSVNLPWNRKLIPRLRDYSTAESNSELNPLNLSALLLARLVVDIIPVSSVTAVQQMNALQYSQALSKSSCARMLAIQDRTLKIKKYIEETRRPLNVTCKIYSKQFTQFQPYYQDQQIKRHTELDELEKLLSVVPSYGNLELSSWLKRWLLLQTDDANKWRSFLRKHTNGFQPKSFEISGSLRNETLQSHLLKLQTTLKEAQEISAENQMDLELDLNSIKTLFEAETEESESYIHPDGIPTNTPKLLIAALRELFMERLLTGTLRDDFDEQVNPLYADQLLTLNSNIWHCLKTLESANHTEITNAWIALKKEVNELQDQGEFAVLLEKIGGGYKGLRSYQRQYRNSVQCYQLENLSTRLDCVQGPSEDGSTDISSRFCYQGPALSGVILSLICQPNGQLRSVPLSELLEWRSALQQTRHLIWENSQLLTSRYSVEVNNLLQVKENARQLLKELEYVRNLSEQEQKANHGFESCAKELEKIIEKLEKEENNNASITRDFEVSLSNALVGAIELCLLTNTPLIDPVEKNRLKNEYVAEDIDCLSTLTTAYDFMKIAMKYRHFGEEIYSELELRLRTALQRQQQLSQKLALRPKKCLYASLVQDITQFLHSNGDCVSLYKLFQLIHSEWENFQGLHVATSAQLKSSIEVLGKLDLWLANAQRFVHHTLSRYSAYYQDFVEPIKCSVNQLRFGLESLKVIFTRVQQAGSVSQAEQMQQTIGDIVQFPSQHPLVIRNIRLYGLLAELPHSEYEYFRLLKAKLSELSNYIALGRVIDETTFAAYDDALSICNQTWQQEEHRRCQLKAEAESLYVTKTKGGVDSEELIEMQEIEHNFPTNLDEDFAEFVSQPTLEQVLKLDKKASAKDKQSQIVVDEDYAFLARNFIDVMTRHTQVYYKEQPKSSKELELHLLAPYQARFQVFANLHGHYKTALGSSLAERACNGLVFGLALQQKQLRDIELEEVVSSSPYDFYKDSNISEIQSCLDVMERIEKRVLEQLEQYPEHAGLADIKLVISRIRRLPAHAPVVRFNTGFQLLRQKLALWNEVAHRNNNLVSEEIEVAEFVQRWTRLELQHWRNCLGQTAAQVELQAYRYWFFIYNLLQQFIHQKQLDHSYTDIKLAEQRFAQDHLLDAQDLGESQRLELAQVVRILRQFVEASCYGDFHIRLQLLQGFELYLHNVERTGKINGLPPLIAALHNLQLYFSQFAGEIADSAKLRRSPIEKKLKEFVKIQSYSKDLSYFSMRNSVASVHRNLNKFLKEYRLSIQEKIYEVFQPKDSTAKDYTFGTDKGKGLRNYNKIKYLHTERQQFVASEKLLEKFAIQEEFLSDNTLLQRLDKHFRTARHIVKETLGQVPYGELITELDDLLASQLERCEHLRSLNVDRSKERTQQKQEAKQILQQKRKALTDLFKMLHRLGANYKTGLLELSLRNEFEDFQLPPYSIRSMLPRLHPTAQQLDEHLDLYYMKSVFKLKLLQNIMLTPLSELGPPNIERIKGFAVDLFLLVQQQREQLSGSTKELHELRNSLDSLRKLAEIIPQAHINQSTLNFVKSADIAMEIKQHLRQIHYVLKQWKLLLSCAPSSFNEESENRLLILSSSQELLNELNNANLEYLSSEKCETYQKSYAEILDNIKKTLELLRTGQNDYLPLAQPIVELLDSVRLKNHTEIAPEAIDLANADTELANIAHSVLMSMQKIYKHHVKTDEVNQNGDAKEQDEESKEALQEQHLKKCLTGELTLDWQQLSLPRVLGKLSNVLLVLKHSHFEGQDKLLCVSAKMLSIVLTVFVEIGSKGFCVPPDLMQDEEGQSKQESKNGEGFGLEDETGENDASDKIESEDQLDDAKRPEDRKDEGDKQEPDCKEEKGIEMSDDFDAKMQDVEKPEEDDSGESEEEEDLNKEMGETEEGAEKLDDQIWGDDEEEKPEEEQEPDMNEEDQGKGSKDEKDAHNDLDTKNDAAKEDGKDEHEKDGLDATNEPSGEDKRKEQAKDIDDMKDPEMDEEQTNTMHNELEEPPEPEEMDLGDMNNVDEGHDDQQEQPTDENPFDIDAMKENMQPAEEPEADRDNEPDANEEGDPQSDGSDSEEDETGTEAHQAEEDQGDGEELKTIDQLKDSKESDDADQEKPEPMDQTEAEEYQHVKEPKNSDKTTLDNATEEQSKKIQHQEDEPPNEEEIETENVDELMESEEPAVDPEDDAQLEQLGAEKTEQKSDKPSKTEKSKEQLETPEGMEIEGEVVPTMTVPRSSETTAHSNSEILLDESSHAEDLSSAEQIELRQQYQKQLTTFRGAQPEHEDYETWQGISNRMTQNARELCEQLRLILEPTKCTRLKGDYRTGRRINMKKIIPYIASQFRKDKIWLRRTKPAQRDYKITIAIDDSKSMHHNNSKTLTLEAISLVSQALTLLESGRLSIVSFGEAPQIILNHTEQFDGPRLVNALNFAQDKTKIAGLLNFIRTANAEESGMGGDNGLFENLLLILSDGRNIFSEGAQNVKNAIKLARLQRIFLVYIIIDNPDNKNSILDIQHVAVNADGSVNINSYLDSFPFPYYVIVRDLNQLPLVLSEAMRQWFELVNSE